MEKKRYEVAGTGIPKKHHLRISELLCVIKMMLEFGDGVLKHVLYTWAHSGHLKVPELCSSMTIQQGSRVIQGRVVL